MKICLSILATILFSLVHANATIAWQNPGPANAYDFHLVVSRVGGLDKFFSDPWGAPSGSSIVNGTVDWEGSTPIAPGGFFSLSHAQLAAAITAGTIEILDAYFTDKSHNRLDYPISAVPEASTFGATALAFCFGLGLFKYKKASQIK